MVAISHTEHLKCIWELHFKFDFNFKNLNSFIWLVVIILCPRWERQVSPICSFVIITKHFTQCKYSFPTTAGNEYNL